MYFPCHATVAIPEATRFARSNQWIRPQARRSSMGFPTTIDLGT
ncbi:hypothetical protein LMG29739_01466 [Paraburkholderia solisilvae]|uniref:Uncharacterized protein n=1 Tax=Paraburkholderia solisilvae TaxID=624376 RepID=A0A6J5DGD5_9BURK|nr:hypothetical protein LMG29739_01466 [Paraburkholderia solisilvae]